MTASVGRETDLVSLLRHLVELDYDAIEAYEAAINKLDSASYRQQMAVFCDDHRRHIVDLNPVIQDLGGEPILKGDIKRVLTKGKVYLSSLISDRAMLSAMKTNEDDTNRAYERAVAHEGISSEVHAILQRNLADERRHREWLVQTLQTLRTEFEQRTSSSSII